MRLSITTITVLIVLAIVFLLCVFLAFRLSIFRDSILKTDKATSDRIRVYIVIDVIAALLISVAFSLVLKEDRNLYRVLETYGNGVGVRCLTDDKNGSTVIPLDKDKTRNIVNWDAIDAEGNVIIPGAWFGNNPDETEAQ